MDDQESTTVIVHPLPTFAGYTTIHELGSGGMARVYLAKDEALDRLVAIKVMNLELLSPEYLARFDAEAKTAAKFRHPNIVGVFASGQVEERPFIAFEYAPGGTLETRIQRSGLSELEALEIARKLAGALAYLHERKIIHRDLKPANIVFNEEAEPLLSDFGIAKAVEADAGLTQPGSAIGSPRYMSPEQLRGEPMTDKSDMYSFGLLLLQMRRGKLQAGDARNAEKLDVGRCSSLMLACLDSDPANRPSAALCASQLDGLIEDASRHTPRKGLLLASAIAASLLVALLMALPIGDTSSVLPKEQDNGIASPSIQLNPAHATLYIDAEEFVESETRLESGQHQVRAVAAGYYGHSELHDVKAGSVVGVELAPLTLPSLTEFQAFHQAFDDVDQYEPGFSRASSVGYPLYDELLSIETDRLGSKTAQVQTAVDRLIGLAEVGDAAAQVALFLLASEGLAGVSAEHAEVGLRSASTRGGFALATYYRALVLRQEAEVADAIDAQTLRKLNELMRLAYDQGLEFVSAELHLLEQIER